jgi:hypothetical protein
VHPLLHPGMRREFWASEQFEVTKRLHKGYASEVYKVSLKEQGEPCARAVHTHACSRALGWTVSVCADL